MHKNNLKFCSDTIGDKNLTCEPLKTLEDIFNWDSSKCQTWEIRSLENRTALCSLGSSQCCHKINSEWRPQKLFDRTTVPRTLVCHDMKGGYLDDRFVYGSEKHSDYRFFHWAGVDIFVYFSHQLLTIAPPVWVNAAHLHGVLILGTFITEWEPGRQVLEKLLRSDEDIQKKFVSQLVNISKCYGMDGWLLNIENGLDEADVPQLRNLVDMLTQEMHKHIPYSQVIWYDSITNKGELKWQNELNANNRMFFDVCDGIFLNYAWKEKSLAQSTCEAGVRALDVYVGVDVYGRGCFGGGGFKTSEAVTVARAHDLSVALFGPGWVHECWAVEKFTPLEYSFWRRLWPLLYIHGPSNLPFESSFCQGFGLHKFCHGQVVSDVPWHNLSQQQPQPTLPSCVSDEGKATELSNREGACINDDGEQKRGCVQHWPNDAFNGGGCLLLLRPITLKDNVLHRLLLCNFEIKSGDHLLVSCAIKSPLQQQASEDLDLTICLLCQDKARGAFRQECLGATNMNKGSSSLNQEEINNLSNIHSHLSDQLLITPYNNWCLRHFVIKAPAHGYNISEICVSMGPRTARALLGWFAIQTFQD